MAAKNTDCPCRNRGCHRIRDCEPCREYHHGRGSTTACERMKGDPVRTETPQVASHAALWTALP
jgi:hypothetical protein